MPLSRSLDDDVPISKDSQAPIVHEHTQRSTLIPDTDKVTCKSNTINESNNENELRIQKKYVNDDDNRLMIDDVLLSGTKKKH